jgi:hypothetical protein
MGPKKGEARAGTLHSPKILPLVNIKVSVCEQMNLHKDLTMGIIHKYLNESPGTYQWQILIWRSGLAEGYTLPYNYPSARPDLRIRIRHWNLPQDHQVSVHFIIMHDTHTPHVGSVTSDTVRINYAVDCTDLTPPSDLNEVTLYSLQLQ